MPTTPTMPTPNDARLDRGLELYGRGRLEEAVALWREVLADDPGNVRARDYLETAGFQTSTFAAVPDAESSDDNGEHERSWRAEVLELVQQRNFEGALARLYAERRRSPRDAEISASIRRLKEHRLHALAVEIGGLDRVITRRELLPATTVEQAAVARLVDDVSTAEDIARASPLGVLRTVEVLLELTGHGISESSGSHWVGELRKQLRAATSPDAPSSATSPVEASRSEEPPTPGPTEDPFDVAFRDGTRAYLERRFEEAERLFERCLELRPGEPRATINLQRLRVRRP